MTKFLGVLLAGLFLQTTAFAGLNTTRVTLEPTNPPIVQAGHLTLQFRLVDSQTHQTLTDQNLVVDSEKLLHFFVFDPAVAVFQHIHPTFNGSVWTIDTDLETNGDYWLWAQGKLASDQTEFAAHARLSVLGGAPANPVPQELGDQRMGADGTSAIMLSDDTIHAGATTMLMVDFSRTDGTQPELTPYLGDMAHFTIVPLGGDGFIHTHPMAGSSPTDMMIHTEFPSPGDYRIWAQFVDGGVLKTVPLSVRVVK